MEDNEQKGKSMSEGILSDAMGIADRIEQRGPFYTDELADLKQPKAAIAVEVALKALEDEYKNQIQTAYSRGLVKGLQIASQLNEVPTSEETAQ